LLRAMLSGASHQHQDPTRFIAAGTARAAATHDVVIVRRP
jgi:hypothetical protein